MVVDTYVADLSEVLCQKQSSTHRAATLIPYCIMADHHKLGLPPNQCLPAKDDYVWGIVGVPYFDTSP